MSFSAFSLQLSALGLQRTPDAGKPQDMSPLSRSLCAVATALAVSLFVYRLAVDVREPHSGRLADEIARLDAESVIALHDLARAVLPTEGEFVPAVSSGDDRMLARLPLADFVGPRPVPEALAVRDLNDSELDLTADLIGGFL